MIEIDDYADSNLFSVVGANVGRTRNYGSPPIHYWYRNVVEALRLIDDGFDKEEGSYKEPLEKSLGDVSFDVRYIGNEAIYIVTDFDFNFATIRSYLRRARTSRSTSTTRSNTSLYISLNPTCFFLCNWS